MEREDTDGSLSVEVETDGFGPEIGNVLINCQGRDFCFGVFVCCVGAFQHGGAMSFTEQYGESRHRNSIIS